MGHRTWRAAAVAVALALAGGLSACGGSSTSSDATPPTDASKATFCKTFTDLGADVTPQQAADKLSDVGTPSDIGSSQRHGFEILVAHLRTLPDKANDQAFTAMAQSLDTSDKSDLNAFLKYYADEC